MKKPSKQQIERAQGRRAPTYSGRRLRELVERGRAELEARRKAKGR